MRVIHLLLSASIVFAIGCGCDASIEIRLTPRTKTLRAGETFTPQLSFFGCGGTERLTDQITWDAVDTTVVRVESASGRTTGLRVGQTVVRGTGRRYGSPGTDIQVTVVSP